MVVRPGVALGGRLTVGATMTGVLVTDGVRVGVGVKVAGKVGVKVGRSSGVAEETCDTAAGGVPPKPKTNCKAMVPSRTGKINQ